MTFLDDFEDTVLELLQRCDRATMLLHAVRHLLDHTDPITSKWYAGDTDAIFILQSAMNGPAYVPETRCEYPSPESTYGACDSLPCGKLADESGFCEKHRGEMGI